MVEAHVEETALPEVFRVSEATDNTACLLTRDLRIVRTNAAWQAFAAANGADPTQPTWQPGLLRGRARASRAGRG